MKTVKQILDKKGSAIHSVTPASTVYEALQKMAKEGIGALVVLDGEELAGIVSERGHAAQLRGVPGLQDGVLDEAESGFLDHGDRRKLAERVDLDPGHLDHGPQLGDLAGVGRGEHQFREVSGRHGISPRRAFC